MYLHLNAKLKTMFKFKRCSKKFLQEFDLGLGLSFMPSFKLRCSLQSHN